MRFVLLGVLLGTTTLPAWACESPPAPEIPADEPLEGRDARKLNEQMVRYVTATSEYVGCLQAEYAADPDGTTTKTNAALANVARVIDSYEERVGPSDELIAAMAKLADRSTEGVTFRSPTGRIGQQERNSRGPALDTTTGKALNTAIVALNAQQPAEARAAIGKLSLERLTPYERGKAEQILFNAAYAEQKYAEAREHLQRAIDSGGLDPQELVDARLKILEIDSKLASEAPAQ